jgi:hypothetical protein
MIPSLLISGVLAMILWKRLGARETADKTNGSDGQNGG